MSTASNDATFSANPNGALAQRTRASALAATAVHDGMAIGYGTGRAAQAVMDLLASRVRTGLRVVGVPSSRSTEAHAIALGLPLTDLDAHPHLDLTIDGADEVDPSRNLIKGGGAALFREKVLATASDRVIIVVDAAKVVTRLGSTRGIPVEVLPFAVGASIRHLAAIGGTATRRTEPLVTSDGPQDGGIPVLTDNGNHVLDVIFAPDRMIDPRALDIAMRAIPGIMVTGLFWSFDATVVVGTSSGVEVLGPPIA